MAETLALSASAELTLTQLARAVESSPSAAQRALEILLADGVVERAGEKRPVYRLRVTETAAHVVGLAAGGLPLRRAAAVGARANSAIEFVARGDRVLIVVFAARKTALEESRGAGFVEALAKRHALAVQYFDHDDVRRELFAQPDLRGRMARTEILYGDLNRTFPDRSRHGTRRGHPLHRPHRSLKVPERKALRTIATRHGVDSLKLFGSAVRSDFRSDSDIDVLFRYRPGVRPSLRSLLALEHALESAFERDVDLIREENLRPELRERVEREAVPLL